MLSISRQLHLQDIIGRIARSETVTLSERSYVNKLAEENQTVSNWLKKASRLQRGDFSTDEIGKLLNDLDLGFADPNSAFSKDYDDIAEWFSGAPSWLTRS